MGGLNLARRVFGGIKWPEHDGVAEISERLARKLSVTDSTFILKNINTSGLFQCYTLPMPQKIPFEEFKQIYSRVPRLCVEVILVKNKQFILIKRAIAPAMGMWHTPGGTILLGESVEEAVKRVAKEELGLKVEVKKLLGYIEYNSFPTYGKDISMAFLVESAEDKIILDKQASEYNWFTEAPDNTIPEQKKFLEENI